MITNDLGSQGPKEDTTMDWLVGMDLSDHGQGALAYTRWLSGVLPEEESFVGVHVLEQDEMRQLLRHHHLAEIEERAAAAVERVVESTGVAEILSERRVICGRTAERALAELAGRGGGVRALIIGRQARRGELRVVRLGRVARRIMRALPAPVVVVPPDLEPKLVGDGPIILAASTQADASGAVRFARDLARDLGRPLLVAHVVPGDETLTAEYVPTGAVSGFFRELREEHERDLAAWMRTHDLGDVAHHMSEGSVVDRLAELALSKRSPLVVCGSRGLGFGMRLFSSSVASDLAAACQVPVAVVPSDERR